ncbi:MAG: DUF4035 domain-containing protein [Bacillota bacterium]
MTLSDLRRRMPLWEFQLWQQFATREPIGGARADLQAAQVCAVLANCHSTKRTFKLSDFLFDFDRGYRPPPTDEELRDIALKANCLMGGTVVRT